MDEKNDFHVVTPESPWFGSGLLNESADKNDFFFTSHLFGLNNEAVSSHTEPDNG